MKTKFSYFPFVILYMLVSFNCTQSVSVENMDVTKLKKRVQNNGDINAFALISMWYHNKKIDNDFLDLSLKMYHHYDYKDAALEIYWGIIYKYNKDVPMDSKELSDLLESVPHQELLIGLSYLEVGVINGNYSCYDELAKYYLTIGNVTKHEEMLRKSEIMYQNNLNKMREKFKAKK